MGSRIYPKLNNQIPIIATTSVIVASVGSFLVEFLPNTVGISKFKDLFTSTKHGSPVSLSSNVQNLFNQVLDDLKIEETQKTIYKPFACIGFDLIRAGYNSIKYGAILGIPVNYSYENKPSIDVSEIRIGYSQEKLNVYHPAASTLIESLVLSDKAKKFGIAREILMTNTNVGYYNCFESPIVITATAFSAEFVRLKLAKISSISLLGKNLIFGTVALVGFSIWFQIRDNINTYFERLVDNELASLSLEYLEGGKEFYSKQLKRNIALRALLGKDGLKEFNAEGDEITFIRRKRTPLTQREEFFNRFQLPSIEQQNG